MFFSHVLLSRCPSSRDIPFARWSFCTLMPRILLMSRPGLTQIDKKSRRMRNGCFGQISLFVTARALAQDDEKLREHS
jgi:hypothetical protein